jgi:hypothetical protein
MGTRMQVIPTFPNLDPSVNVVKLPDLPRRSGSQLVPAREQALTRSTQCGVDLFRQYSRP